MSTGRIRGRKAMNSCSLAMVGDRRDRGVVSNIKAKPNTKATGGGPAKEQMM